MVMEARAEANYLVRDISLQGYYLLAWFFNAIIPARYHHILVSVICTFGMHIRGIIKMWDMNQANKYYPWGGVQSSFGDLVEMDSLGHQGTFASLFEG